MWCCYANANAGRQLYIYHLKYWHIRIPLSLFLSLFTDLLACLFLFIFRSDIDCCELYKCLYFKLFTMFAYLVLNSKDILIKTRVYILLLSNAHRERLTLFQNYEKLSGHESFQESIITYVTSIKI